MYNYANENVKGKWAEYVRDRITECYDKAKKKDYKASKKRLENWLGR